MIHFNIEDTLLPGEWKLSCIYGLPYMSYRKQFWTELSIISNSIQGLKVILECLIVVIKIKKGQNYVASSRYYLENT